MNPSRSWRNSSVARFVSVTVVVLLPLLAAVLAFESEKAMAAGTNWSIHASSQPTFFSSTHNARCENHPGSRLCDAYVLLATNVGTHSSTGPVIATSVLPAGIKAVHIRGINIGTNETMSCVLGSLECTAGAGLPPGTSLVITIDVIVSSEGVGSLGGTASVRESGGLPSATVLTATDSSSLPSFGVEDFEMDTFEEAGLGDIQAGGRPYMLQTNFDLNTVDIEEEGEGSYSPSGGLKDVVIELPLGFFGNPQALPRCPLKDIVPGGSGRPLCPAASRVGTVVFEKAPGKFSLSEAGNATAVYNMEPETGYPAEFGFTVYNKPAFIYANLVRVNGTYRLRITTPGAPAIETDGVSVRLFGNPGERDEGGTPGVAFLTNPVDCTNSPLTASLQADSWQSPGAYTVPRESAMYPRIVGCEALQFQSKLRILPGTSQADEPAGYEFDIEVPQRESIVTPATPELKNATLTLPLGVALSPAAADGLQACEELGSKGINMEGRESVEMGNGARDDSPYSDGMEHLAPGHCPAASTIGDVEVTTPVLAKPLMGHVYVATPRCGGPGQSPCTEADATSGNIFGLYLEASGAGAIVKLRGTASVNPATGQLTATFKENPQLPFSDLVLRLKEGPRAPLVNPQTCGTATTTSDFVPWSTPITPDATPFAIFDVDWNGNGGACPATLPLAPSFDAGTLTPTADAFSPFTLTLTRGDREQDLSQIGIQTPPGLLGMLSKVTLCGEPQAARGECSSASEIGSAVASAGSGPDPFWVQGGRVYLTGPYDGAPFGLSIVVPAVAGPFNLGDVVVRAAISVNPTTSALTVTSGPLPQIIDGVPLRVRTVNVTISRPGFMFNPTNCTTQQIAGTVAGAQGAKATVSDPFTASNCGSLPFKTKFAVSTQANTSHADGASLGVKVTDAPGQANIAKVAVTLPKKLPSRLTTIQHACPEAVFAANPATCDPKSAIGIATAVSPVLPVTLSGPAYLVSHGGAAFPDVVVILQGEGVRVDLLGSVDIFKGVTSSTFASVPDVPIESFELRLPESPHSALTTAEISPKAHGSLCGQSLLMPTTITAQNGAQIKQNTKIAVTGCPKVKKKAKGKKSVRVSGAGYRRNRR